MREKSRCNEKRLRNALKKVLIGWKKGRERGRRKVSLGLYRKNPGRRKVSFVRD